MAVTSMWFTRGGAAAVLVAATLSSGCGGFARQSQSSSQLVIVSILAASATSGAVPTTFVNGPLLSDVVATSGTIFNDFGQVTFRVMLKDPGAPGSPTAPSNLNDVTITRYTVRYSRSDGRNTQGVDVPRSIDGALALTVSVNATGVAVVELVRHVAKLEAPLAALGSSPVVLTMIADVTFYGRDQAGNELSATGNVQINFANFN